VNEPSIIIDAGPLVASLVKQDEYHDWASRIIADLPAPLITSESVVTEACFLLHRHQLPLDSLWRLFERESLIIDFDLQTEVEAIRAFSSKYERFPMSLADATLVRLPEIHDNATIFTLDGHFRIYRKHGRRQIPLIIPEER
jgi:uncharacterized protein